MSTWKKHTRPYMDTKETPGGSEGGPRLLPCGGEADNGAQLPSVGEVLHLFPNRSSEGGQEVDGRLALLAANGHLLVVEGHPLAVLLVGARLPIEDRDVVISHHLRVRLVLASVSS